MRKNIYSQYRFVSNNNNNKPQSSESNHELANKLDFINLKRRKKKRFDTRTEARFL